MKEYFTGALSVVFWILMAVLVIRDDNWQYIGLGAFLALFIFVILSKPNDIRYYKF